jgi:hypothetical protein
LKKFFFTDDVLALAFIPSAISLFPSQRPNHDRFIGAKEPTIGTDLLNENNGSELDEDVDELELNNEPEPEDSFDEELEGSVGEESDLISDEELGENLHLLSQHLSTLFLIRPEVNAHS